MGMINALAYEIHENAVQHGWWEKEREFPEIAALIHSEISEALEEYRDGKPDLYFVVETKQNDGTIVPEIRSYYSGYYSENEKPEGIAIELADAIIRILDYCAKKRIDIEEAIRMKNEYNKGRPYRHGGKKC